MISIAIHVYSTNLDENEFPKKTLIVGRVESLRDEENPEQDAQEFGEDIFKLVDEFAPEDIDIVVEFRHGDHSGKSLRVPR